MKLRTTTPVSFSKIVTYGLAAILLAVVAFFVVSQMTQPASADQYDARIDALQADMSRYQQEAEKLNQQASTLSNALAQLSNQRNALQSQIQLSQAQQDKLTIQIADTEKRIKENQDALGVTLADLYVDDSISPIEMLASSSNISDYLDKQEYRNAIRDELGTTIKEVKSLRTELTTKKKEVEKVLADQKVARSDLVAKETEQASLLAQTKNDESEYQNMIADNKEEIARAKALQAALRARANSTGGYTVVKSGSLGSYASLWAPNNCWMGGPGGWYSYGGADGNGGDGRGYGCRQCASYVAWRVAKETNVYYQWGNGGSFASAAINAGYTDLGGNPQPGSIAVMWGNPGHVAWVEAVDGDQILVSQYNWQINGQYGMYSEMWLSKHVFDQYVKI